ncbi:hypothetical protein Tco_1002194 [Tanacetum coccineum]|uniref:Uncharacterized protein n=1 Tax=Tanacetum coccineum TaxID=301880 RepID=A0ABQ5F5P6_9ASTR
MAINLLHMGLVWSQCGCKHKWGRSKKYFLVIVDWTIPDTLEIFFTIPRNEIQKVLKDFLKMIQRNLQALVITVHGKTVTLVEAASNDVLASKIPLSSLVESLVATAGYTQEQNQSDIHSWKAADHIINDRKLP